MEAEGDNSKYASWDPFTLDAVNMTATPKCLARLNRELSLYHQNPTSGIFLVPDETDLTLCHGLILGPRSTPYHGGAFYFVLRCPSDYPFVPPKVKLMTTDEGKVCFHPKLFENGKICISIFSMGTISSSWTSAKDLSTIMFAIRSLMNENPYERGFKRNPEAAKIYNTYILHETLRVAVCGMLEGNTCDSRNMPESLRYEMKRSFLENYSYFVDACKELKRRDGKKMFDPTERCPKCAPPQRRFAFEKLLVRLKKIKERVDDRQGVKKLAARAKFVAAMSFVGFCLWFLS